MENTRMWAALAASLALGASAQAFAQEDPSLEGEARGVFEAGAAAYEGGRYEEALGYFQRSYELSGRPALLYNIATAAERAHQDELALSNYERYLERVPDSPVRARVTTRITALRRRLGPAAGGGGASVDPVPWIVVGAGAAVAIAGGVLLGLGLSDRATVEGAQDGAVWSEGAADAYARGPAILTSGVVLLPVGVVVAALGVVWALVAPSGGGEQATLRIGPGGLELTGRF